MEWGSWNPFFNGKCWYESVKFPITKSPCFVISVLNLWFGVDSFPKRNNNSEFSELLWGQNVFQCPFNFFNPHMLTANRIPLNGISWFSLRLDHTVLIWVLSILNFFSDPSFPSSFHMMKISSNQPTHIIICWSTLDQMQNCNIWTGRADHRNRPRFIFFERFRNLIWNKVSQQPRRNKLSGVATCWWCYGLPTIAWLK